MKSRSVQAVVTGAAGRMGRLLVQLLHLEEGMDLCGATEAPGHPALGRDAGEVAGTGLLGICIEPTLEASLPRADVIIDFTSAESSIAHLDRAVAAEKAIVIGSTGFSDLQRQALLQSGPRTRCFVAPNMSVGVNVVLKLLEQAARLLGPEYDVEIVETHHRFKADAPSGTAVRMAEVLAGVLGSDLASAAHYGRRGMTGPRRADEIGIQAVRAGDTVGEHTVIFGGLGERIEITHRAHSRDLFARGALRAARWIVGQPPGLYNMNHLLGL